MWQEGSDLTVIPTRENGLSIRLEEHAIALKAWNLDSEELLSGLGVPNSDVVKGACGEEFGVASWESNVVDLFVVAGVSQLWGNVIGVAPVDGGLGGSTEEVSRVSCKRNGCNGSHNLGLFLNLHVLGSNLCDGTISRTEEKVTVGE